MENLNSGTKELVSINIEDRLGEVTDLSTDTVDYRVLNEDGSDKLAWGLATNVEGMRVDCLIDTTGWETGHYELFVRPTIGSEQPILGPFDFDLV
jgi:hypothetical protein